MKIYRICLFKNIGERYPKRLYGVRFAGKISFSDIENTEYQVCPGINNLVFSLPPAD